ncbi:hypothetical protein E3N88_31043 [Mikania micrantha]|uniref:Uncharacterized protein n=1 Tax=Mikania micrantha TaxID=192012 RepID=A0A5N6MP86_9ASTR|nr:hypothetical protein E3N88_31043 [Mikania micrantha]
MSCLRSSNEAPSPSHEIAPPDIVSTNDEAYQGEGDGTSFFPSARDVDQSDAWVIVFWCEVQPRRVGYKSVSGHRNLGVPSPSFAEFVTEDER